MTTNKPKYRAVRMFGPGQPPSVKYCPDCGATLDYWNTSEGWKWFCFGKCKKVKEDIK